MCAAGAGEAWRLPRSPSRDSVTTDLSLFSVSSAASDAKLLRILASKAGQGPEPARGGGSPNPECSLARGLLAAQRPAEDSCRELLAGCAALCSALGLHRSFSAGDVLGGAAEGDAHLRSATSELALGAAGEARVLCAASRSCSMRVAVGGSRLPSPQRAAPQPFALLPDLNKKVRQSYLRRRLLSTRRALERLSRSDFSLDTLEAAAAGVAGAAGGPGPRTLAVPPLAGSTSPQPAPDDAAASVALFPDALHLALTTADLERDRGRPLSKYERNMMIFNWLHTLDEAAQL